MGIHICPRPEITWLKNRENPDIWGKKQTSVKGTSLQSSSPDAHAQLLTEGEKDSKER